MGKTTLLWLVAATIVFPTVVQAQQIDNLIDALYQAYHNYPSIAAEKAEVEAAQESIAQAIARRKPQLNFDLGHQERRQDYKTGELFTTSSTNAGISVAQALYHSGQLMVGIDRAKVQKAARAQRLRAAEQDLLLEVVTVYSDVLRDQAIVNLSEENKKRLAQQLEATQVRRQVGEVTKTDVAQAESRYAQSVAELAAARGAFEVSRNNFRRTIGVYPGVLQTLNLRLALPQGLEQATLMTLKHHPDIQYAYYDAEIAQYNIQEAEFERLPKFDVEGGYRVARGENQTFFNRSAQDYNEWSVSATMRMPLYQGGGLKASIRRQKHLQARRRQDILMARRQLTAQTAEAWYDLEASRAQLRSYKTAAETAAQAYDGVTQEMQVGSRTVLDALDAQQELLQAEVNYQTAKRNELVNQYRLQAAIGQLDFPHLNLPAPRDTATPQESGIGPKPGNAMLPSIDFPTDAGYDR